MTGALGILTTTIPMVVATGTTIKVVEAVFRDKNGKSVGTLHVHRNTKSKRMTSHRHTQGQLWHAHKGMTGYGRNKQNFRVRRS